MRRFLLAVVSLCATVGTATGTTIVAPTFDELVARAETIFIGKVVDVRCAAINSPRGRAIVTDVTFDVERTLKGATSPTRSLEFLGGTIGNETLRVEGMPEFHVGDRDVLFVADRGRPMSPIVGFMYGRFRIVPDPLTGVDTIRTHDGRPLTALEEVGNLQPPARTIPRHVLTVAEFASAVGQRVRPGRQPQ